MWTIVGNVLRIPSGSYDFAHEYRITDQGGVLHRFVKEDGTERLDGSSNWEFAPPRYVKSLLHPDFSDPVEQICKAAGVASIRMPVEYSPPKKSSKRRR